MEIALVIIALLIAVIIGLVIYNVIINKKIKTFKDINQKVTSLNVLQDFMSTVRRYNAC